MPLMKTTIILFLFSAAAVLLPMCHQRCPDTVCACKCPCAERGAKEFTENSASNPNSPSADERDVKKSKALKLPDVFKKMKLERSAKREDISNMKSGDTCGGGFCTGGPAGDLTAENEPTGREVCCTDHVINATTSTRVETKPPRKNAKWKNCSALGDGRNGEKCEGTFACFHKVSDKHCLERVGCGESTFGEDKLLRYLVCDDVGSSRAAALAPVVYTSCADAGGAKPLDRCSGDFLCEVAGGFETSMREIPSCEGQKGFCPTKWEDKWISLLYCDGESIHIYNFSSRV